MLEVCLDPIPFVNVIKADIKDQIIPHKIRSSGKWETLQGFSCVVLSLPCWEGLESPPEKPRCPWCPGLQGCPLRFRLETCAILVPEACTLPSLRHEVHEDSPQGGVLARAAMPSPFFCSSSQTGMVCWDTTMRRIIVLPCKFVKSCPSSLVRYREKCLLNPMSVRGLSHRDLLLLWQTGDVQDWFLFGSSFF